MTNRGMVAPNDEAYAAIESPNGELGFYVVGDGSAACLAGPLPAAFVHPFRALSAPDSRPHAQRRGSRVGQFEHHRGGVGSLGKEFYMSMPESQPFRQPPPGANPRRGTMPIYYLDREHRGTFSAFGCWRW